MNNSFSPMSEDKTPIPHQRFFGPQAESLPPEGPAPSIDDFSVKPLPDEIPAPEAAPAPEAPEAPETPETPSADTAENKPDKEHDAYYRETKDRLIHVRKQRNAIILQMDKLDDDRIEKGSEDYDDDSRELSKLQNDLWHKNNLIDALVKVLISLG